MGVLDRVREALYISSEPRVVSQKELFAGALVDIIKGPMEIREISLSSIEEFTKSGQLQVKEPKKIKVIGEESEINLELGNSISGIKKVSKRDTSVIEFTLHSDEGETSSHKCKLTELMDIVRSIYPGYTVDLEK